MIFQRTDSGLKAKYLFYREPLIWVEGREDITFFSQIIGNHKIQAAGGKPNCLKLIDNLLKNNGAYVVVLDGDYDILEAIEEPHRCVIILERYSSDNYLFEKQPLEKVCRGYCSASSNGELIGDKFEKLVQHLNDELSELLALDVANHRCNTGLCVCPQRVESLLNQPTGITIAQNRVESICATSRARLDPEEVDRARALVEQYIYNRRIVDILRGHLTFSIIRQLFIYLVKKETGRKPNIDNDGLRFLISLHVWSGTLSSDHKKLKRKLFSAIKEAEKLRESLINKKVMITRVNN